VTTKSRLVVVTEQMNSPHGTQMLASLVIDEAISAGFEVALFTPRFDADQSSWTRFLKDRQVRVFSAGFWWLTRWYLPHRVLTRTLWRFVRHFRPQLIWSPDNEPMTCCALEGRPDDAPPFFVHDPGDALVQFGTYPNLWFSVCDRVAGLSLHGRRQLANAKRHYAITNPMKVIWPASATPSGGFEPCAAMSSVKFGQFGRLDDNKSVALSILAIASLRARGYAVELHINGTGPEETTLKTLSRQYDLESCVFFNGQYDRQTVDERIAGVHVGLLTSKREGFGIVLLELLSRGRPVIACDVGGAREVLDELGGGWVVPAQDLISLTEQMKKLCDDPELIQRVGAHGQKVWRSHFTPAQMFERYLTFWRECGVDL
jgi:glycosyltransferase involved in cell wall biosynthesis